jgi:hypothetical protein
VQLGAPPADVASELANPGKMPLGDALYPVAIRGDGVQWNPDNTRLVACEFSVDRTAPQDTLSGAAFPVTPSA